MTQLVTLTPPNVTALISRCGEPCRLPLPGILTELRLSMKRDMDLIRELLLKIESGEKGFKTLSYDEAEMLGSTSEKALSQEEADKLSGHLNLIEQAGF